MRRLKTMGKRRLKFQDLATLLDIEEIISLKVLMIQMTILYSAQQCLSLEKKNDTLRFRRQFRFSVLTKKKPILEGDRRF